MFFSIKVKKCCKRWGNVAILWHNFNAKFVWLGKFLKKIQSEKYKGEFFQGKTSYKTAGKKSFSDLNKKTKET